MGCRVDKLEVCPPTPTVNAVGASQALTRIIRQSKESSSKIVWINHVKAITNQRQSDRQRKMEKKNWGKGGECDEMRYLQSLCQDIGNTSGVSLELAHKVSSQDAESRERRRDDGNIVDVFAVVIILHGEGRS
jgi:hypothetical protein